MDTELAQYHDRLMSCRALIDLNALASNLSFIQGQAPGAEIVAMVKADAYGHGLVTVSRFLQSRGVRHFGVATLEEGLILRREGISGTILLMGGGGFIHAPEAVVEAKITPMVSSLDELQSLTHLARRNKLNDPIRFHLDLDTGISRAGLVVSDQPELELRPFVKELNSAAPWVQLTGLATHFADAEVAGCPYSLMQVERFVKALRYIDESGIGPLVVHLAKSSAILNHLGEGLARQVWIRPGIALYGVSPFQEQGEIAGLKPILSLRAPVTLRKSIRSGTAVGYGNTWIAPRDTELAILRAGYGDGYNWRLSNQGQVIIHGRLAPVIGRVSMDLTAVDVTEVVADFGSESCAVGTLATLIGEEGEQEITAFDLASRCQTISYEILTSISKRVVRLYKGF